MRWKRVLSSVPDAAVRWPVWFVLGWLLVAGGLNLAVPQIESVISHATTPFVPDSAPSVRTLQRMDAAFGSGRSKSIAVAVFERDTKLTAADRALVRSRVTELAADTDAASFVQRVDQRPDLFRALTSKDGKAVYVQIGLSTPTGAPTSNQQIDKIREVVSRGTPPGLNVAVTGISPSVGDLFTQIDKSLLLITAVTVVLIAVILLLIYRSVVVMGLVLGQIGLSLAIARAAAAWFGEHVFPISTFTASLLTVVVLGASTDYAVFLISRFHEARRDGLDPADAARVAGRRIGGVVIGSALTVVLATVAMGFGKIGLFRTTGPAIAVGVACSLAIALTLTPAAMALAGRRGLLEPRLEKRSRLWHGVSAGLTRRPGVVLVAGLVPLLALAAVLPVLSTTLDERSGQPDDTESNVGYRLLGAHYPMSEVLPDYLLITADHDMRTVPDLAALERISTAVAGVPHVKEVRSITRPLATPIPQASVGYRAGVVGSQLTKANTKLASGQKALGALARGSGQLSTGAQTLSSGAGQLAAGAHTLATGAAKAGAGSSALLSGSQQLKRGLSRLRSGAGTARSGSAALQTGASTLAGGITSAQRGANQAVTGLGRALTALQNDPLCTLDPICSQARAGITQVYDAQRTQLLPGLATAQTGATTLSTKLAQLTTGLGTLTTGLGTSVTGASTLETAQRTLNTGLKTIGTGAGALSTRSGQLSAGADMLATGASGAQRGTTRAATSLTTLQKGLGQAATVLRTTAAASKDPAVGGFYLPPATLRDKALATASGIYLSPDGRTARLFVLSDDDPFTRSAMRQVPQVLTAARNAAHDTTLADAGIDNTGIAGINRDLDDLAAKDFLLVAIIALLAVLLILVFLLRSVVAPLFLLASVVLSYGAALGLGTLVWQVILDRPLDWSVPIITFILLVAVGADYNLLLMKRVREEAPDGARARIGGAVVSTSRVITTAGVIFAASMFALLAGTAVNLQQIGFTIGAGLLLDTFIVRTLVVPSIAALLGARMWWAGRPDAGTTDGGPAADTGSGDPPGGERERPLPRQHASYAGSAAP